MKKEKIQYDVLPCFCCYYLTVDLQKKPQIQGSQLNVWIRVELANGVQYFWGAN